MNKTYLYDIHGGCGSTTFKLNINNDTFNGNFRSNWMGGNDKNIECKLKGRVVKNTICMYNLYTDEILDVKTLIKHDCKEFDNIHNKDISSVTFRLFDIGGISNFDSLDHEFDGIVMGGCSVNEDATYNAVMTVCYGQRFGAYNYGANKKRKDDIIDILCKQMRYIPLKDTTISVISDDRED
ncbi:hypothetical protein Klosneuvirus_2_163 [Klosneuvirus KNV1]|uniref:Uncharacterized protein n=1 Tax=Klosneuvirus KNV1 TaxID=1977640 RepID=A0A1V0SJ26_9VIRU|nr:hypothetical protein Klosneuvirus_2_163 [Klosneuvirus KNV1]